jgi:ATP-binding cassette subfamily C protein CydCD
VPVLAIGALLWVDWISAVIVIVTLPLLPFFAALIGRTTQDDTDRRWRAMSSLAGHFLDVMRGLPTLVSYGRAERQIETIAAVSEKHRAATMRTLRLAFLSSAALELLASISVAIVAVTVGLRLSHGSMTLFSGLLAILLAPEAYWPIRRVGAEFHAAADGAAALDAILGELSPPSSSAVDVTSASTGYVQGQRMHPAALKPTSASRGCVEEVGVRVEGVTYTYPGAQQPVLREVTLEAGPGLTVLTGRSGAGKTTLLELAAGLRTPQSGTVLAGRSHLVSQRPFLPASTLREAVRLGNRSSDDAIWSALREVGLDGFVASLPAVLDTGIGDDGFGLSAGQRARIALARGPALRCPGAPPRRAHGPSRRLRERTGPRPHPAARRPAYGHRRHAPARTARPRRPPGRPRRPRRSAAMTTPRRILLAGLLGGLATSAGIALTATSGWLIVRASERPVLLTLFVAIVGVRAFGMARPLLRYVERILSHDAALRDLADRRTAVYADLIPLTPARLGKGSRASILSGVVDDLTDVVESSVRVTVPLVASAVAGLLAALLAAAFDPRVGLVLAVFLLALLGVGVVGRWLEGAAQDTLTAARVEVLRVSDLVARNATELQAIGAQEAALSWIDTAHETLRRSVTRQSRGRALVSAALLLATAAATVASAMLVDVAAVGAPVAALLVVVPVALGDALAPLVDVIRAAARTAGSERRLNTLLLQTPAVTEPPTADPKPLPQHPALALEAVTAGWTGTRTDLGPTDLDLPPGRSLAVVGANGSGKSTLLAVLARHLAPSSGRYVVGGSDVVDRSLAQVRAAIAVVDDEPHIFAGALRDNLVLAAPEVSDEELDDALRRAGLAAWVDSLPEGMDTRLGTGARGVSGGERARLGLARALASARPVILLDEPVAHLDHATALAVLADVTSATGGRTVVMATHRPEGLDNFDEVRDLSHHPALSTTEKEL